MPPEDCGAGVSPARSQFSTLNEKPLHASLKQWYARPGDEFEVLAGKSLIDIVRGELLIEIQTANFSQLRRKLSRLVETHRVRLVYPVAAEKWVVRTDSNGAETGRRKSPKHGKIENVFGELVSIPKLMAHPNFSLEVLLIREEEIRRHAPGKAWRRRGWLRCERRLLDVVESRVFRGPADLVALLPSDLGEPFTTATLAQAGKIPRRLAQQMVYCLREMDEIQITGKKGNNLLYMRA
ncbi:MAG: hypothetical protein NTZ09_05350 [Candidatus Hydrogenedentes bacterium]|nr:hypothetical protein [Candidatus Hydrogenedentota bacterium]